MSRPRSRASACSSSRSGRSTPASTSPASRKALSRSRNDGEGVTLELPPATFRDPELDLERSYVYDRDRGAIDRLQSLFGDDTGVEQELYPLAEEKLADAARNGSGLLARAERNTRLMLVGLLRSLGFTSVDVRFSEV